MAKWKCPDCGEFHACAPVAQEILADTAQAQAGGKTTKGYSLYYVPCRCGCGCGHTCDLIYGPYARVHNAIGEAKLAGELGTQLKQMREASALARQEHLARIHGTKAT